VNYDQLNFIVALEEHCDCPRCRKDCSYKEGFNMCWTHRISNQDTHTGAHFCLEHEQYHCHKHWKQCCKRFGYSVMTLRPVTTAHLHKRAQEIIAEQNAEIAKLEAYMEQIKRARFICAECRQVACICDMTQWKRYSKKRRDDIRNTNNNVGPA